MALIGREIIQSRVWEDITPELAPSLNYKYTYPMTVIDAVYSDMELNGPTLKEILDGINIKLNSLQPIFPSKPANYLMTYGGAPGAVGSMKISQKIPWNPDEQSTTNIPTEKAVGDLLYSLGLVDENGNVDPEGGLRVRWADIIGRPIIYDELGNNDNGFITQKGITNIINIINNSISDISNGIDNKFNSVNDKLSNHITDQNNPHAVSLNQIGAASSDALNFHIENIDNPHQVTATQIQLGNVNNTSDMDKPISTATQIALDAINTLIHNITNDMGDLNYVIDVIYDQPSGQMKFTLRDNSEIIIYIPIDGLIDEIIYDDNSKELIITELSGNIKRVNVSDLFIRYIGSTNAHITISITGDQISGNQIINATINPKTITNNEILDNTIITSLIKDQNITTEKIKDLSITTIKLDNESVINEKIGPLAVTTTKISNRAVTGDKLFTSSIDNRLLGVNVNGDNPIWLQANSDMISDNSIKTIHYQNDSITSDKLADNSVITAKIESLSVTNDKLSNLSVTNDKIANNTITGNKIIESVILNGHPELYESPNDDSYNNQISNTKWVIDQITSSLLTNDNLGDRIVDGRVLFTSSTNNRVLSVIDANTNPIWSTINNEMMESDSIITKNIVDGSITTNKMLDYAVTSNKILNKAVKTVHIDNDSVTSSQLFKSDKADMILATLSDNSNPVYTKLTRGMISDAIIIGQHIEENSLPLDRLIPSPLENKVIATARAGSDPIWVSVKNGMIESRAIDGRTLFSSYDNDRILGVTLKDSDPSWLQINSNMIAERVIKREHIDYGAIWGEHLQEKIIESKHILDWTIQSNNIAPRAITGIELFTSPLPNRILGVTSMPYSNPDWLQVVTDMIEDKAVNGDKLFTSHHDYRVLGTTDAEKPPEYLMITADFIVDDSITSNKLKRDLVLYGTPELTHRPDISADNNQIPDTRWVRQTISDLINDFHPDILYDTIYTEMISDRAITAPKFFTSAQAPRVLGITHPNQDVEFILIEESLIVDGAVTTNKLQRDIHLLGSPILDVRPSPYASDNQDNGQLIPDCQWVLDRINEGGTGGGGGSGTPIIGPGSITTDLINNRAVTGDKLFTSINNNMVLAVIDANTNPQYIKIKNEMMADKSIDGRTLFSSNQPNRVLGVINPNDNPDWIELQNNMFGNLIVENHQLKDRVVTGDKIEEFVITQGKLADEPMIDNRRLWDNAVSTQKIADNAVENKKIANQAISSEKLGSNLVLPLHPTIPEHTSYETRSLRNTILSPNAPIDGMNGDIWFQYI